MISMNTWALSLEALSWILVQEEHGDILSEGRDQSVGEAEVARICEAEHWKGGSNLVKEIQKYGYGSS